MGTRLAARRFSIREYQRMIDAGVLAEDEHVEVADASLERDRGAKLALCTAGGIPVV